MMAQALVTFLILLFPGIPILFHSRTAAEYSIGEKLILSVPLSLAYWVVGFWWLSIIPMPLSLWVYTSLAGAIVWTVIVWRLRIKPIAMLQLSTHHLPFVTFLIIILIPQILLLSRQALPAGNDMSMHTYIASIITQTNRFPKTLMPTVPVTSFGMYPFGFSTIAAVLGAINRLPAYTNALILTAIVHLLFDFSLYLILRKKFTPTISAVSAVLVGWTSHNPHLFISWGANPSVLSLTFLILAVALYRPFRKSERVLPVVLFFAASFLTSYMFPLALLYILVPVLLFALLIYPQKIGPLKKILSTPFFLAVLLLPFILKAATASLHLSEAARKFVQAFHYEETAAWAGSFSWQGLREIISILITITDRSLLLLFTLLMPLLWHSHKKIVYIILYTTGVICFFIVNARHWWLPGSPILYPYRTTVLLLVPIAWGIALLLTEFRKRGPLFLILTLTIILGIFIPQMKYTRYLEDSLAGVSVTRNDLAAMEWLKANTNKNNIIWNRYQDGGLWIPAIISRPITQYHTNPVDYDAIIKSAKLLPDYAFIGEAIPQEMPIADEVAVTFPDAGNWRFDIVYHRGNAAVYKITR